MARRKRALGCGAQTTGLALLNASTLAVDLLAKQAYSHK
jgi:hypothetical protein